MEFVSNTKDMLSMVGNVVPRTDGPGIQMPLPEEMGDRSVISRIIYGKTASGKRYIETISNKNGFPTYGEASIPEIIVFAKRAMLDMPESPFTPELVILAVKIDQVLNKFK